MSVSIFISREAEQVQQLAQFCAEKQITLISKSLITFEFVPFNVPIHWDTIFFPSSRAVEFFFHQVDKSFLIGKKIACAGSETAKAIEARHLHVDFIPSHPGDTNLVRNEFQSWLGTRNVLYVGSNLAKKSVLSGLESDQCKFIEVYNTIFSPIIIPDCSIYIFTSPSNVLAFVDGNSFPSTAKVISWGKTTENELMKQNIHVYQTLLKSSEDELVEVLWRIL